MAESLLLEDQVSLPMTAFRAIMGYLGLVSRGSPSYPKSQVNALGAGTRTKVRRRGNCDETEILGKNLSGYGQGRWARAALILLLATSPSTASAIDQALITCDQVRVFAERHCILFDSRVNRLRARAIALTEGLVLTSANLRAAARCLQEQAPRNQGCQ